jgi:sporulation integral membrane protein YlbJ
MENIQPAYIKSGNTKKLQGKSLKKKNRLPACFFALAFASLLCIYPEDCAKGALRGVECCLQVLIPSLFPFMILGIFTVQTGAAAAVGKLMERPFRFLFRLPGCAAPVLFMSMIGGYPVGPRSTLSLLESGQITKEEAGRMLCFCVNAGPAFVLSIVGAGYLKSSYAGLLLLGGQLLSCCLLGLLCRGKSCKKSCPQKPTKRIGSPESEKSYLPIGEALIRSTEAAVRSMASTCAFVILFGMLSYFAVSYLPKGILPAAATAFLEVTQGCYELSKEEIPLWGYALALGWGGLSVQFQILSLFREPVLSPWKFRIFRLLHGLLAAACTLGLTKLFPPSPLAEETFSNFSGILSPAAPVSPAAAIALVALCAVFLLSLTQERFAATPGSLLKHISRNRHSIR